MSMITPITVEGFPQYARPWNNITPFTYRDGLTYLEVLEGMRVWLRDSLVPHVDGEMLAIGEAWNKEVLALVGAVETAMATQAQTVNVALEDHNSIVDGALDQHNTDIALIIQNANAAMASAVEDINARADQWMLTQISNNDAITKDIVIDPLSQTRKSIDSIIRDKSAPLNKVKSLIKTPDVRAYIGVADTAQRMKLPSHISATDSEATHPSVLHFPEGWNGWRYWMGFTPYPGSNAAHEDPCIAVSQDGKTWSTPIGLTNPLDDAPSAAQYNADIEIFMSVDGLTMYGVWRYTDVNTRVVQFKMRSTTDGITWTPAVVIMSHADYNVANYVSPTFAHDGTQWIMWGIDQSAGPNTLVRLTAPAITGPWSAPTVCTASATAGRDMWHIEVTRTANGYVAIMNDTALNQNGGTGDLYLMSSADGLTWERGWLLFDREFGNEYNSFYRASLVPTDDGYDVYYGAWNTATNIWGIYRGQIKYDSALRTTDTRWIPATAFKPPVAGATEGNLVSIFNGWMLDPVAAEGVATTFTLPGWKRFALEIWFAKPDANAGDVVFSTNYQQINPGTAITAALTIMGTPVPLSGAANMVFKSTHIVSLLTGTDGPWYIRVMREAANAGDTYAADVLFLGAKLIRLS